MAQSGFSDVVVIAGGDLITDWHNEGDRVNFIFSCTKSILSILFGILSGRHETIGLDDPITRHLPTLGPYGDKYSGITVKHLLSMTSGIDWNEMRKGNTDYNKMVKGNWLEYVLSKDVIGTKTGTFNYCDGNSLLLSAIISGYSGMSAHDYAKQFLFGPLDIAKTTWKEQDGLTMGGTGLHMKSRDLALIGSVIVNRGMYRSTRILDETWIDQMSSIHSAGYPELFGSYGLHWWISPMELNKKTDMYYAMGAHGQYLFIIPEKKLSVCIRKKVGKMKDMFLPWDFLYNIILPFF